MKVGRAVGVDDGYFRRGLSPRAPLVFTLMKGPTVEGFRFSWVKVDGSDATQKIIDVLGPVSNQLGVIFLYGTLFAGTNVVSLTWLWRELGRPVVAISDEEPREEEVIGALEVWGRKESLDRYRENPPMAKIETSRGTLWASWVGSSRGDVLRAIETYQITSKVPEPLRVSNLLGREVGIWLSG